MKTLVFLFLIAILAMPAFAQPGQFAVPADAELDKFPIMNGPLSTREMADMKLAPMTLKQPVVFQNHFRSLKGKKGRFVLEELPAGTIVLVDTKAEIRYKADCGNRLVTIKDQPLIQEVTTEKPRVSVVPTPVPSTWSRFWNKAGKMWGDSWEAIGAFLGFFLPFWILFALLGLLGYLIYRAFQNRQQGQGGQGQNPPPPAPPLAPAPAPQVAPAPVPQTPTDAPRLFPDDGFMYEPAGSTGPTRIQVGQNLGRVEATHNKQDGSMTFRIYERR